MKKIELPATPSGIDEAYPGQFGIFPWLAAAMGLPTPLFLITTRKSSGLANVQPNCWGMMLGTGSEPRFMFMTHNYTDTLRLIRETGQFVVNFASAEFRDQIMRTAGTYDEQSDEVLASGLTPVPASTVNAPRIAEAFGHLECTLEWIRDVEEDSKANSLVMGRIVAAAMDEDCMRGSKADLIRRRAVPYWVGAHYDIDRKRIVVDGSGTVTLAADSLGEA